MMIEISDIEHAISEAENGRPAEFPVVPGYSSPKVRRLLNNLCSNPGAIYLEIGTHLGSTFIPALHGNESLATCIDNWSLDGHTKADFQANLNRFLPGRDVVVIESDAFQVDLNLIDQPVDVYFYDGPHDRNSQYMAFSYFNSVLADRFVVLIDDVRWVEPREETQRAIKDLKYKNLWERTLPAKGRTDLEAWWDGLYIALLEKP